jgi:outer membrane lipoprotein SlyB
MWELRLVAAVDLPGYCRSNRIMKPFIRTTLIASSVAALALVGTEAAAAKGCIKGAIIGGVAGHYAANHGLLGAAAGCLYGHHRAKQQDLQQEQERDLQHRQQGQANGRGGI